MKAYVPRMEYDTNYGLSESMGPGPVHLGMENESKVGAIGKPGLMWDARIVDDAGEDVARGEVGEVILKGAGVMKGYYKNPDLTASTIRKGWLRTGDLGRFDEEGFIYLVDRKKIWSSAAERTSIRSKWKRSSRGIIRSATARSSAFPTTASSRPHARWSSLSRGRP